MTADKLAQILRKAIPYLREEGAKYTDDGSNEPLELAREAEELLAEHDAQPAQAAQPVGCLTVSRFRGADSMVNHDLDYYGDLPDGSYSVFVTPPAQPSADTEVSNEMVLRAVHASLDWPHPLTHFEARKALEAAMAQESDAARAAKCGES